MTFEQQFKKIFKNDLEAIFGGNFKVFVTNDITFRDFHKNEILVVIKTGQGTTSGVENVLATNSVSTITFKYETIYQQEILSVLTDYVNEITGKYFETDDGLIYKLGFATPYVIGSANVENVDNDSIYTSFAQIAGNIFYSDLAKPRKKYIWFANQKVEIKGIQQYNDSKSYNYTTSDTSDLYGKQHFSGLARTIIFTVYAKNNEICNRLKNDKLYNKEYIFQIGEEDDDDKELLKVIFSSNTYTESNNVGVYAVNLQVVDEVEEED